MSLYIYQLMHTLSAQNLRTRQWCVFSSLILIGMGTQVVVNVLCDPGAAAHPDPVAESAG